jgi:dihydroorotate dehydrogenase electron transfer subunit
MRLSSAIIIKNTQLRAGVHLLEMSAPILAQTMQPGQYCMIRCGPEQTSDPLLRRPFFIHSIRRGAGLCTLLVYVHGRGTSWLAAQQEGARLDMLGPLGRGWEMHPTTSTLLLIAEDQRIAAMTLLAQTAIERDLSVTLIGSFQSAIDVYSPALLPPEVEYVIVTSDGSLGIAGNPSSVLEENLPWADAAYCGVSHETAIDLYARFERLRGKHFAQALLLHPLVCGNGVCLTCSVETHSGSKLVCRDGPVFDLRDIAR